MSRESIQRSLEDALRKKLTEVVESHSAMCTAADIGLTALLMIRGRLAVGYPEWIDAVQEIDESLRKMNEAAEGHRTLCP